MGVRMMEGQTIVALCQREDGPTTVTHDNVTLFIPSCFYLKLDLVFTCGEVRLGLRICANWRCSEGGGGDTSNANWIRGP